MVEEEEVKVAKMERAARVEKMAKMERITARAEKVAKMERRTARKNHKLSKMHK